MLKPFILGMIVFYKFLACRLYSKAFKLTQPTTPFMSRYLQPVAA